MAAVATPWGVGSKGRARVTLNVLPTLPNADPYPATVEALGKGLGRWVLDWGQG